MKILNTAPISNVMKGLIKSKARGVSFTVVEAHKMSEDRLILKTADVISIHLPLTEGRDPHPQHGLG